VHEQPTEQPTVEQKQFTALYERQVNTVYRVCFSYLRNPADTEDATQAVFLKLLAQPRVFTSEEHEKAWLIRVAANHCKDLLKSSWSKRSALEEAGELAAPIEPGDDLLELVMTLPETQRVCIYLFYYEGYNAKEIGAMTGKPHSTVRNHLSEARKALRLRLRDDSDD
jgi:RNA polymerase sigma-70 factor (ECF subfamily)